MDLRTHFIGFNEQLSAVLCTNEHELSEPVAGMTFGVAWMDERAPHAGERHMDMAGNEVRPL